jgi:hypothetical protein
MGGIAILTYKKHRNNYKFGVYAGNEATRFYITPLVGIKSPSANFEFSTLIMPGDAWTLLVLEGFDYKGNSETFS